VGEPTLRGHSGTLAQSSCPYPELVGARLAVYDPRWPQLYELEVVDVANALAPVVATEHIGSTSVPHLAAKPTIDIAVGVRALTLPSTAWNQMEALGYHYGGDHGLPQHVFRKGESAPWRFLVHVVEYDGAMWREYLHFRDYLRADPAGAARYAELKESLLAEGGNWYAGRDKESFIRPILDDA
jgi:GrpB-like predicted nucleotidyltransferase (UPF0157 family)